MSHWNDLRNALISILSDRPSQPEARPFISICYRLARAYLLTKQQRRLLPKTDLSIDDLAYDCVAELFARDDDDRYHALHTYFAEIALDETGDAELLEATRRLVFSAVNDSLFRHYREMDPLLARLIRNLKRAARGRPGITIVRKHNRNWIVFEEPTRSLPVMPPEFLEAHLAPHVLDDLNAASVLAAATDVLRHQTLYQSAVPLVELAQVVRSIILRARHTDQPQGQPLVHLDEFEKLIRESIEQVRTLLRSQYVQREKVDGKTFDAYLQALHDQMYSYSAQTQGTRLSLYQALANHLNGLTRAEYGRTHRSILEYLSRRTRRHLAARLRGEHIFG